MERTAGLMTRHECDAVVVTCIDFRFQPYIDQWLDEQFTPGAYDRVSLAGGIKNLDAVMEQIGISHRLHHIKSVFLINHEDCGAYGEEGTHERHIEDLEAAKSRIAALDENLDVQTFYLHLDGTFETVSS